MCFFNAAHNEFITQIPERIPHETGPANPDAAVPPILIKAYPTRNMRHGRDKQQVQNSWEEKCYAAGAVFTKTQVPKEVHTVPLLRSTSGQVRFDQRREMTIQQKNIYCINLASDDRRSGTREDAEATTKATERKTQGHYRNEGQVVITSIGRFSSLLSSLALRDSPLPD